MLTELEGFKSMTVFLNYYSKDFKSDDIASLLGSMALIDERPLDIALWNDWLQAMEKVKNTNEEMTDTEGFKTMGFFLKQYFKGYKHKDVVNLVKLTNDKFKSKNLWTLWEKSIEEVKNGSFEFDAYFEK